MLVFSLRDRLARCHGSHSGVRVEGSEAYGAHALEWSDSPNEIRYNIFDVDLCILFLCEFKIKIKTLLLVIPPGQT